MRYADLFVGLLSIAIGLFLVVAAACNWDGVFQLRSVRWLGERLGRAGALGVLCVLGVLAIVIGFSIALGYVFHRSSGPT